MPIKGLCLAFTMAVISAPKHTENRHLPPSSLLTLFLPLLLPILALLLHSTKW